jgi:hypothetical protein
MMLTIFIFGATDMKKFERFCALHRDKGIKHLMLYIIIGNVIFFMLAQTDRGATIADYFYFSKALILNGHLWRLVSFIFIPPTMSFIPFALTLYFYYLMSRVLESEWGTLKFNIFYLSGIAITALYSLVADAFPTAFYINMSLFFAYATLYPDNQILLFFVLPIKVKILAYIDAAYFLFMIIFNAFPNNLVPLMAVMNYLVFFGGDIYRIMRRERRTAKNTINFKNKLNQLRREQGYLHKCTVCGRTDTDHPELEFRYCSLCKGYACYCADHIMNHEHVK